MSFFKKLVESILGEKIGQARITPVTIKILFVFIIFIFVSNFTTNYFNLAYNRSIMTRLLKKILIKDLKEIYTFTSNQYKIQKYQPNNNNQESYKTITQIGDGLLENKNSIILGIEKNGKIAFYSSKIGSEEKFKDYKKLHFTTIGIDKNDKQDKGEGILSFNFLNREYYGVYKYHPDWKLFILKAEETNEFQAESKKAFKNIVFIIIILTFICSILGLIVMRSILRFIGYITNALMGMNRSQKIEYVDLKNAPVDQITYLGMSFNALSSTINNLITIFRKFVSDDLVEKIYKEKDIRLEGSKKELAILFTDIKSFTFITETLGSDIIELLNIHYDKAISNIIEEEGIMGAIIGDALLAIYGTFSSKKKNKSYQALLSAYKIINSTLGFRSKMEERKKELLKTKGRDFTEEEENIYKAILIDVGVGLDMGEVFYGNIGSNRQMTNTVIGDRVNSASRLESLTRVYKVPVICSSFIKEDIEKNVLNHDIIFLEIDMVRVKGKREFSKVYWPVYKNMVSPKQVKNMDAFKIALKKYYQGDWKQANELLEKIDLPIKDEFLKRTKMKVPPNWQGIWEMTKK